MPNESSSVDQTSETLLAEGEENRLEWGGGINQGHSGVESAIFVATDSRLIYSFGSGHFKEVAFDHIESVEVTAEDESEIEGHDPDGVIISSGVSVVFGAILAVGGFLSMNSAPTFSILLGLLFIGVGIILYLHVKTNYDELKEEHEVIDYTVYNIVLRTTAEGPLTEPIHIETKQNIGTELSKLIQNNR